MGNEMRGSAAPPTLCVVMPALDEEAGIGDAVRSSADALDALCDQGLLSGYELIVVDDGSTDATAHIVERLADDLAAVRLIRHGRNRGVGGALRSAIAATECELILSTDADMPVDLARLADALPLLAPPEVGMVAGHRSTFDQEAAFRRCAARVYDQVVHALISVRVPDVNFPFKLLATETARRAEIRSEGALVDVELLAKVQGLHLRIVPLEIDYHARTTGESKTMRPRLLLRLLRELFQQRAELRACARTAR
ncbi:MAG: putative glycosyltransferase [Ilumatobacteraceae bacterium]|nr:putative glycosyltransferase [Ilumatobacteraceae bacterium]